jgi:tetratricopeptide (TPR) repeat protein
MEPLGEFESTLAILEDVLRGASEETAPARFARVHYWMGNNFGNMGRYDEARVHLQRCLDLSRQSESHEAEGDAHNYLSQLDGFQGYLRSALAHADAAILHIRERENPGGLAWVPAFKAWLLSELEPASDWETPMGEARIWVERSGNERARCILAAIRSSTLLATQEYKEAQQEATEAVALAEKVGEGIQLVLCLAYAGLAALYVGKRDLAFNFFRRGELEGDRVGHSLGLAYLRLAQAEAFLRLGRIQEAIHPAETALSFCQRLDLGGYLQRALEINAEILASQSPRDETRIQAMMKQAASLVERSESPWYRIKHLMAHSRINLKRGEPETARENLTAARSLYRKMGMEGSTREMESLDDELNRRKTKGVGDVCGE